MPSGSGFKVCLRDFWTYFSFGPISPSYSPRLSVKECSCHFADVETEAQLLNGFLQFQNSRGRQSDFFFFKFFLAPRLHSFLSYFLGRGSVYVSQTGGLVL